METLCSACSKVKTKDHICDGMQDTPRVNANLFRYGTNLDGDYKEEGVEPSLARCLEREVYRLTKENKRLYDRDGNASMQLSYETSEYPFNLIDLQVSDFGVADNIYILSSPFVTALVAENEQLKAEKSKLVDVLGLAQSRLRAPLPLIKAKGFGDLMQAIDKALK